MNVFSSMGQNESDTNEDKQFPTYKQWEAKQPKTFSFWQELRRSDPHKYYSNKTQATMLEHAEQLGDKFFDDKDKEPWDK